MPQINLQDNNINVKISKSNTLKVNSITLGTPSDIVEILAQGEIKNFNSPSKSQLKIEESLISKKNLTTRYLS